LVHLYFFKLCCVWPFSVVEGYPFFDHPFGLEAVLQFVQIDRLLFERQPDAFDKAVIEIPAPAVYYLQVFARKHREASRF
jgi:hypothetical protein